MRLSALSRRAGRLALDSVRRPRSRRWVLGIAAVYLVVYLLAIRHLVVSLGGLTRFVDTPSVTVVDNWPSRLFDQIAPFAFEPVAAVYPTSHVALFVAPLNLAMGLLLGMLVGINVVAAWAVGHGARACGRRAFPGLLGALPGLLTGFACCVPTLALLVGSQFTLAIVALRSAFFPVAVAALLASLIWIARRAERVPQQHPAGAGAPAEVRTG